ncbi:hypothetical protein [Robertkochia sediminum]|uniref:hypothetical protein n=1 Tax=Robertkochia sediminum TaxID=2785326 RepID=UPI001933B30C|nr:hypothetical protein [Robertkochia sediminum]MBL7471481.1 hypothetical protein [Robertkochia sediminum]
MSKNIYNSFEEIDLQLEILKTEAQLEKAHISQEYDAARSQLSIFSVVGSVAGAMAKKALIFRIMNKLFK